VDYFTKWVEAKPVASITSLNVKKFVWENIICRFGLPLKLISDNGTQFADTRFQEWCKDLGIKQAFTSVAHPQANGEVERHNRTIVEGIKVRLGSEGPSWLDELPNVLWACRTMHRSSTGETPYSLTYGQEAVIPSELGIQTRRVQAIQQEDNDRELRMNLDLKEERLEIAAIREAQYKEKLQKYYNSKVSHQDFNEKDYVLRLNEASRAVPQGKLSKRWEGPYMIKEVLGKGAYKLERLDGSPVPRTWNNAQLRKCYM
jgi:transposase InsO family protein